MKRLKTITTSPQLARQWLEVLRTRERRARRAGHAEWERIYAREVRTWERIVDDLGPYDDPLCRGRGRGRVRGT